MQIILAKTAGFCFGVDRAVEMVAESVRSGNKTATLGPTIHNRHVVDKFLKLGVREIAAPEEAEPGETVIIRAHGVPKRVQEKLAGSGANVLDATCPFVKKIHTIVKNETEKGRKILIFGSPTHPEVEAIASFCDDPVIVQSPEEIENWLSEEPSRRNLPISMVSQTTSAQKMWESCVRIAKKECTNCEIFDTICRATEMRQEEAIRLSRKCDAMVVVGDASSANTGRLAMICKQHCRTVTLVDHAGDLDLGLFSGAATIGITAGASTPSWIIKEVNNTMSEELKVETAQEENFAELLEQSLKTLNNGDKVTGTVMAIGSTEIQVDLGTKHTAYIPVEDLTSDPSVKVEDIVHVGDEIEAIVVHVNDGEGVVRLSKKRLEAGKAWDSVAPSSSVPRLICSYPKEAS